MRHASFQIHRTSDDRTWVVEEEGGGQLGGLFSTRAAALDYVGGEARRFESARAVIELSRGGCSRAGAASSHPEFTRQPEGRR